MSQARHILAVDQSTSGTKSLVYGLDGRLVDRFSIEHAPIHPSAGRVEHDAEELWRNTLAVIARAMEEHDGFAWLSITNQRETFVIFDRATGTPLHNAVVWQCRRGDDVCDELMAGGHGETVARKTGLKIDSYFSAPKLAAFLREHPDLAAKLSSGEAIFGTIDTYLVHRLTGGRTFATDSTNASRTLLYNISTLSWDAELCELFGVPMIALPEVRDSAARFGACDHPSVPHGLPIAGVMGDSQAALFAHRCFQPGQAKVTLGTGSSILLNTGSKLPAAGIRTLAWTHGGVPTYCLEGIISHSAATLTWLRDQLGLIRSFDETEVAARAVPDNGGVHLVPAFTGLSAPHWSPTARAAIVGLSASSTRNHVIRAALEAIAFQVKDALDAMTADSGMTLTKLHADGGASKNRFVMQLMADLVQAQVTVCDLPDFSPLGATYAGMLAMGTRSTFADLEALPVEEEQVVPAMSAAGTVELHRGWRRAVRQVLAGTAST